MTDPSASPDADSSHSTHPAQLSVKDLLKQRAQVAAELEDDFQPIPPPPPLGGSRVAQVPVPPFSPGDALPPPPPPPPMATPRSAEEMTGAYPRKGRGPGSSIGTQLPPEELPPPPSFRPLAQMSSSVNADDAVLDRVYVPPALLPQSAIFAGLGAAVLVSPVFGVALFFGAVGFIGYMINVILCYAGGWCIGTACNRFGGRGYKSGLMSLGSFCLSLFIGKFLFFFLLFGIMGGAINQQREQTDEQLLELLMMIGGATTSWDEMKADYSIIETEEDLANFMLTYELGELDARGDLTEESILTFKKEVVPVMDKETGSDVASKLPPPLSHRRIDSGMGALAFFFSTISIFDFIFAALGLYVAYREGAAQDGDL